MATAIHRQRLLNRIFTTLKKHVPAADPEPRPVLEQLLYAVCREGVSREKADRAFKNLQAIFFDWNEIRVSAAREVEEALADLPDAETRAVRIISLLQEVFETTYSFDLESLHKKGLKQAQKQLERYQGSNAYIVASALQHALGGHALPLDDDMQRTLRRLDLLDGEPGDDTALTSLEHFIPKQRGPFFCEIVGDLAQRYCHDAAPRCSQCPMNDLCPTGQENLSARSTRGHARAKAR